MKKLLKTLALALVLTLITGVIPVSAASTKVSLTAPSKPIFVGGCTAAKTSGKKTSYKSYVDVTSLIKNYNKSTMTVKLYTSDKSIASVSNKTLKVTAVAKGTATITVKVYKAGTKTVLLNTSFEITVKKNASKSDIKVSGIKSGKTFNVGDSITVKLSNGKDTDKRRLTGSDNVTVKSLGSNKWKVTFNAPGAFTLNAEAYYSSTYKKATAVKVITGTVAEVAVVEPTPEVTPTPEPTPTEAPAPKSEISQTNLTTVEITEIQNAGLTKSDVDLYTKEGSIKIDQNALVKSVEVKDGIAQITVFSGFTANTVYYVKIGEEELSFTAVPSTLKDVKKIEIATTRVKVGESTNIELKYYTLSGDKYVDITSAVSGNATLYLSLTNSNPESATLISQNITFYEVNKSAVITATLATGEYDSSTFTPITVSTQAKIVSYEETYAGEYIYSVVANDDVYLSSKDTVSHEFTLDEEVVLEALFKYTDGSYRSFKDTGYTVTSSNNSVVMVGSMTANGGYGLVPISSGSATLLVYNGTVFVTAFEVKVKPARVATSFEVSINDGKSALNINASVNDLLVIKATAYDQYGDVYPNATFTATQNDGNKIATGIVTSLSFSGNNCPIYSSDVALSSTPSSDTILINVTCNSITNSKTCPVTFKVKNVAFSTDVYSSANIRMKIEGSSTIDTVLGMGAQENPSTVITAQFSSNGYFVSEEVGELLSYNPLTETPTAAELGMVTDEVRLFCTIALNGKVLDTSASGCIYADYGFIEFTPFAPSEKLEAGVYTVTIYRIKAGAASLQVNPLAARTITVVDGTPEVTVAQKASVGSGTLQSVVGECFNFYLDGAPINSTYVTAVDSQVISSSKYYVRNVTLTIPNSTYGSYTIDVPIGKLIEIK